METLSWKANWRHNTLEFLIKELETAPDVSRSAITSRAIISAAKVTDWGPVRDSLSLLQRNDNMPQVTSMQARPNEEAAAAWPAIRKKMVADLGIESGRILIPYIIELIWLNYLKELRAKALIVGTGVAPTDLSGPDMVKCLVQMLLLDRDADKLTINEIKQILLNWKE